jgi:hypothetical protein
VRQAEGVKGMDALGVRLSASLPVLDFDCRGYSQS